MKKLGKIPDGGVWGYVGRQQGDRKKAATPGLRRNKYRHARTGHAFVHTVIGDHSRVAYAEVHDDDRAVTVAGVLRRADAWFTARVVVCTRLSGNGSDCLREKRT
ncbi:MAG: hypothetical protein QOI76_4285 [Frankiales bacterium]|nr:hypothetical protein [Frankiales bacterium]